MAENAKNIEGNTGALPSDDSADGVRAAHKLLEQLQFSPNKIEASNPVVENIAAAVHEDIDSTDLPTLHEPPVTLDIVSNAGIADITLPQGVKPPNTETMLGEMNWAEPKEALQTPYTAEQNEADAAEAAAKQTKQSDTTPSIPSNKSRITPNTSESNEPRRGLIASIVHKVKKVFRAIFGKKKKQEKVKKTSTVAIQSEDVQESNDTQQSSKTKGSHDESKVNTGDDSKKDAKASSNENLTEQIAPHKTNNNQKIGPPASKNWDRYVTPSEISKIKLPLIKLSTFPDVTKLLLSARNNYLLQQYRSGKISDKQFDKHVPNIYKEANESFSTYLPFILNLLHKDVNDSKKQNTSQAEINQKTEYYNFLHKFHTKGDVDMRSSAFHDFLKVTKDLVLKYPASFHNFRNSISSNEHSISEDKYMTLINVSKTKNISKLTLTNKELKFIESGNTEEVQKIVRDMPSKLPNIINNFKFRFDKNSDEFKTLQKLEEYFTKNKDDKSETSNILNSSKFKDFSHIVDRYYEDIQPFYTILKQKTLIKHLLSNSDIQLVQKFDSKKAQETSKNIVSKLPVIIDALKYSVVPNSNDFNSLNSLKTSILNSSQNNILEPDKLQKITETLETNLNKTDLKNNQRLKYNLNKKALSFRNLIYNESLTAKNRKLSSIANDASKILQNIPKAKSISHLVSLWQKLEDLEQEYEVFFGGEKNKAQSNQSQAVNSNKPEDRVTKSEGNDTAKHVPPPHHRAM